MLVLTFLVNFKGLIKILLGTKKLWNPLFIGLLIFKLVCNKEKDIEPEQTGLLSKVTWSNANQSGEVVYE